jgi:hypothetical protein
MSRRPQPKHRLTSDDEFYQLVGQFHVLWSSLDLSIDFAIGKFLKLPAKDTHLVTTGMFYGRKIRLLLDLVNRDRKLPYRLRTKYNQSLKALLGSKRDLLTHGYLSSGPDSVSFFLRKSGDQFSVQNQTFTIEEFREHIRRFAEACGSLQECLDATAGGTTFKAFATAVFSLNRRSNKSPATPAAKK